MTKNIYIIYINIFSIIYISYYNKLIVNIYIFFIIIILILKIIIFFIYLYYLYIISNLKNFINLNFFHLKLILKVLGTLRRRTRLREFTTSRPLRAALRLVPTGHPGAILRAP